MKLIRRQGSYENESLVSDEVTSEALRAAFLSFHDDDSLELEASDGSQIQTSFSRENSRYFLNLVEVSRRGEPSSWYVEGQLENRQDVIRAFEYFLCGDRRLGEEFCWTEAPRRMGAEELEAELQKVRQETQEILATFDDEERRKFEEQRNHYAMMSDQERSLEVAASRRRHDAEVAEWMAEREKTERLLREESDAAIAKAEKVQELAIQQQAEYLNAVATTQMAESLTYQPRILDIANYGHVKEKMVCPHCQERGYIHVKKISKKMGVSGGKATAAILTVGLSLWAAGLSRKEKMSQAFCASCENTWVF